jgi:hypothetical protein
MLQRPGDVLMAHDPKGNKFLVKVAETREYIKNKKIVREVIGRIGRKTFAFNEDYDGFSNWPEGWGLTFAHPEPKPIRVGCIVEYTNRSPNEGAEATYELKVLGMLPNSEYEGCDPYYSGRFACVVLKTTVNRKYGFTPLKPGDSKLVRIDQISKVLRKGKGLELIPHRIYMTRKEENEFHERDDYRDE